MTEYPIKVVPFHYIPPEWEIVGQNLYRIVVPGGWIYRTYVPNFGLSSTYVPYPQIGNNEQSNIIQVSDKSVKENVPPPPRKKYHR